MSLVAGVDSSTQSCKVVVLDAATGAEVRSGRADHPHGTEVHPDAWWAALQEALHEAGGLADVEALSVGGQQHGMVCLDESGEVVRPALLWNDTRSAPAARDLVLEAGGAQAWADAVGTVPVASLTVTKLRWLAKHEPDDAARVAAIALPHDWLTWRLRGTGDIADLVTDRSDASGTGYFDATTSSYRRDLLALALGSDAHADRLVLPRVLEANEGVGTGRDRSMVLGPGCGDNAGAALGLQLAPGQTWVSLGTSGVVASVSATSVHDATGLIAGFADATGNYLPLAATLNGSRVLDAACMLLGASHDELSELALAGAPGAEGLVLVPYLEGERTPNLPDATGSLHGITLTSCTRENFARAAIEGVLCLLADALQAMRDQGVSVDQVTLTGGGSRSRAVRELAPSVLGVPVVVPPSAEYVAIGAARQAAWVLAGNATPPSWSREGSTTLDSLQACHVLARYRRAATAMSNLP